MKPSNIPGRPNFRRDTRHRLGPGEGFVDIVCGSRLTRGSLTDVSLSGLAISFDADGTLWDVRKVYTERPRARR